MRWVEMEKEESEGLRSKRKERLALDGRRSFLFFFFSFSMWKVVCACVWYLEKKYSFYYVVRGSQRERVFIKKTRGDFCSNYYSVLTNPTITLRNRQQMNVMRGEGKKKTKKKNYFSSSIVEEKNFRKLAKFHGVSKTRGKKEKKKERSISWGGTEEVTLHGTSGIS